MNKMTTKSRLTFGLIGFLLLSFFLYGKSWKQPNPIRHDMSSYYGYLPAALIYHDLTLSFDDGTQDDKFSWSTQAQNGKIFRMTMGLALLEAPFFLVADLSAQLLGFERAPYSPYYVFFVFFGSFLYQLWGLWFLFKIIVHYFSEKTGVMVVLGISLGTNLLYYTNHEALMAHSFNFFLYSALLYSTLLWHKKPSNSLAIKIGICLGFLILIRPIHALAILIPLLYNSQEKAKWAMLKEHFSHLVFIAFSVALVLSPQLIYWKWLSGDWLYYSYGDEGFFFDAPMIFKGLFGFRKGWLIYTPLMFFALLGLWPLFKKEKAFTVLFVTFLPLYIYVVFSWWCWWYGGGFGSRPMIDILALMALPLAAAINWIEKRFSYGIFLVWFIVVSCMGLNLFQIKQYKSSLLHWDGMNWPMYKTLFLNKSWPSNYNELIDSPDYEAAKKGNRDI